MCKKLMFLVSFVVLLGMVNSVSAGDIHWDDGGADHYWCTPANWIPDNVPNSVDTVYINPPPYQGPVIDCVVDVNNVFGPIYQATDANQSMDIVSGPVTIKQWWAVVADGSGTATVNISGGTVTVGGFTGEYAWTPKLRDNMSLEPYESIGGQNKKTIINLTGDADVTIRTNEVGILLAKEENSELEMNISGNAKLQIPRGKRAWLVANDGMAVVNISDNAQVSLGGRMSFCDGSSGYAELHMSGGLLSVPDKYLSIDSGSGILDFSGGTADLKGIAFDGSATSTCEVNIRGTANVSAWDSVSLSEGAACPSWLNISDTGSLSTEQLFMAGDAGAECTLNMTGGSLGVGIEMQAPADPNGKANIKLHGGTIECGAFNHGGANWQMDVCGGTMIIDSNVVPEIETDIATGHIIAYGGGITDYVVVDGKTTVWAVKGPPPGDFDKNGVVDWNDLAFLLEQWLDRCRVGKWCDGRDLNQSGDVNFDDFVIFALGWLETWP